MASQWRDLDMGVTLDLAFGGVNEEAAPAALAPALAAMAALEAGAIANVDEGRAVGHYWLRTPELAPDGLGAEIVRVREACRALAAAVHAERRFTTLLVLGIGGSALGPQLVADALGEPHDRMRVVFVDNTDPDGFARIVGLLDLRETLVLCISKSGGTPETRNALVEAEAAFARAEIDMRPQAIAITGEGSRLWEHAARWRARLPMWDWVGGRTSVTSAVGLLPALLQGVDVDALLAGAATMDAATRRPEYLANPAARLAWAWHTLSGAGKNRRAMVMLPYRDRLVLLSRYLQQLVMESVGKTLDRRGNPVRAGLTVYGNKGSTDQHAYVQQLRDGPDDHFVTFVAVQDDGWYGAADVEPGVDAGDYLQGLFLGTRRALHEAGHPTLTLTLSQLDAFRLGAVIALYERAVGLFAELLDVNAYHQPGVEAGKKAASAILALKPGLIAALREEGDTAAELLARAGLTADAHTLAAAHALLWRLAVNERGVTVSPGAAAEGDRFRRAG
jgi:glucose-6-phosphate isomerase